MRHRITIRNEINGVPIAEIPVRAVDTGIPLRTLMFHLMSKDINAPIGGMVDGTLVILNDWRLQALQERLGVPVTPEPSLLVIVDVIH